MNYSRMLLLPTIAVIGFAAGHAVSAAFSAPPREGQRMELGNFSVSLAVKDLAASRSFYEKLGFRSVAGDGRSWLILQNETATIGLFQGLFDRNTLTFNPGWTRDQQTLADFDDVRAIQRQLKEQGIELLAETDPDGEGPAHIMIQDPDGNPILIDQHVGKGIRH